MQNEFVYWLPSNGEKKKIITKANSVIFIGANGAGKSRLGAWLERQELEQVHRIGAQRSLNFPEAIPLQSYRVSEEFVLFGNADQPTRNKKIFKYGGVFEKSDLYITHLFDDFTYVLSALIAKSNNEKDDFYQKCKIAEADNSLHPHTPVTAIDKLFAIWQDIFPHRELIYEDSQFFGKDPKMESKYSANAMSDGERSALYFIAQVLCVPNGKTLLIDEPELHMHRSLMNRLWLTLEEYRQDCLFIYITHDAQFASQHINSDKYWVKNYSGADLWNITKIEDENFPEDLYIELLGNRKNVLFVEGNKGSYDSQLYTLLYKDYYVIPCGSCTQVIARTKAFNNTAIIHYYNAYGIIDRDYRSDYELQELRKDHIYSLNVAEVENLFITEELIRAVATILGRDDSEIFQNIKKYIFERFEKQLESQVCLSVIAEIKYRLSTLYIDNHDMEKAKVTLQEGWQNINFESIENEKEELFNTVNDSKDYYRIIQIFNEKGLSKSIGHYMSISNNEYCQTICGMMKNGSLNPEILFSKYLPSEADIPRHITGTDR